MPRPTKIGPEFTFGIYMEKLLGEPILIIKTSWGGRSLHTDFRPPSAGPYVWSDYELAQCKRRGDDLEKIKADKVKDTGVFYRHMIEHVRKVLADIKRVVPEYDPKQGYELAGFVWFQGFNDLVSDWTYDNQMQARRVRHVRRTAGDVHSRCAQGSVGAEDALRDWRHGDWRRRKRKKPPQMYFRQAQAAPASLPEFKGNVVAVATAPYWDDDLDALQERMEQFRPKMDQEAKKESEV